MQEDERDQREQYIRQRTMGVPVAILGLLLAGVVYVLARPALRARALKEKGAYAQAKVLSRYCSTARGADTCTGKLLVTTGDGREFHAQATWRQSVQVPDELDVLFDPGDPKRAYIPTEVELPMPAVFLLFLSAVAVLFGLGAVISGTLGLRRLQ